MALSPNILASLIQANLAASGANGKNLEKFCTGVATGIVMSIVGKTFTTMDVGTVPGVGAGVGIGLIGLSSSIMKATALNLMPRQGKNAPTLIQAITDAVISHLSLATLSSVNTPVYLGTGTIVVGSITVIANEMCSNIDSQLKSQGANGDNRTQLATAIGTGVASNILSSGSGILVITGTPTGIPVPGTGTGTGIIT